MIGGEVGRGLLHSLFLHSAMNCCIHGTDSHYQLLGFKSKPNLASGLRSCSVIIGTCC